MGGHIVAEAENWPPSFRQPVVPVATGRVFSLFRLTPTSDERAPRCDALELHCRVRTGPESFDQPGRYRQASLADEQHHSVSGVVGELPRQLVDRRQRV
jgi:hypothetical protein